jgi:hypothetical protein
MELENGEVAITTEPLRCREPSCGEPKESLERSSCWYINGTYSNSQSTRVVVLLGEHHTKLWKITTETLRKIVLADQFDLP